MKFSEDLSNRTLKYIAVFVIAILFFEMVFASPLRSAGKSAAQSLLHPVSADTVVPAQTANGLPAGTGNTAQPRQSRNSQAQPGRTDLPAATAAQDPLPKQDTAKADSLGYKNFLDNIISGKNTDSLEYNPKERLVHIYKDGDVTYGATNVKADYMRISMDTRELFAHGIADTLGKESHVVLTEGPKSYTMDTARYNIKTQRGKLKNVVTQEGEGILHGSNVKKMHDNSIHIKDGKYTTCDDPDCPHFYLHLTKGKVMPNDKVIVGISYMVIEGVPTPFVIPEGFFPLIQGRKSGFIIPSYGEDWTKGFFLRNGGYYFTLGDHADLMLRGGIYSKGTWFVEASSRYVKRYKFTGNVGLRFVTDVLGDRGAPDYSNTRNFSLNWTHSQDPKANPGSTFSASVNFQTSGYSRNATTIQESLNQTTNSTVSYSKSWAGTPFSLSSNIQLSQNARDSLYTIGMPNVVFNVSRINPFKRKNAVGKPKWYEQISMNYTGNLSNRVTVKEYDLFEEQMFKDMETSVTHSIPVQTSFNVLSYINLSPSFRYNETWLFKKVERAWDQYEERQVITDTTYGFYRVYDYNFGVSSSTKVYGTYAFKSPTSFLQAVRHTLTPTVGITYTPDFSHPRFGFYQPIQVSADGRTDLYTPFSKSAPRNRSAALSFSLAQTLEAKVLSKTDTSGLKKLSIIDNFSFSSSYNFLADSLNLDVFRLNLRMTIPGLKNFGINLSATLDPYEVIEGSNGNPVRINKFMIRRGRLGRITNTSWTAGYTFNGGQSNSNANSMHPANPQTINPFFFDPDNPLDPLLRRQMMTAAYYDFSVPWSFGFNYSVSYTNNGLTSNVTQTVNFNSQIKLTERWGINVTSGYDFKLKQLSSTMLTITRDLHCWQFNFTWVPFGRHKQWSFHISAKSSLLRDLKYDQSNSQYDTMYDDL